MTATEQDRKGWRRWAGVEVLARLMEVGPSENGRVVLSAAVQKAYALIHGAATETDLAVDIEILIKLGTEGSWRGAAKLLDARQALLTGRAQDPVAGLLASLTAKVGDGVGAEFLQGVLATQRFYQGEPDPLLLSLRVIARPFSDELDLSILDGGPPLPGDNGDLDQGTSPPTRAEVHVSPPAPPLPAAAAPQSESSSSHSPPESSPTTSP